MAKTLLAAATSLLLIATAAAQPAPVEITNAWARATPGGAETGAVYLTVTAPAGDRLTGLETPAASKAELHEMKMEGGIMKMRALSEVDVPAGAAVTLKPGGVHVMLLGLKHPLRAGDKFPLVLDFAKAGRREVSVTVEKTGAMRPVGQSNSAAGLPAQR